MFRTATTRSPDPQQGDTDEGKPGQGHSERQRCSPQPEWMIHIRAVGTVARIEARAHRYGMNGSPPTGQSFHRRKASARAAAAM
jgi:hypothetical protein